MSKKEEFINFVKEVMDHANVDATFMSENARFYWEALQESEEIEKPKFTDNGKIILKFLKDHSDIKMWKSKDIAEELFIGSKTVSGAMRKLVTDGYVEKTGKDPIIYSITENGLNINIEE